MKIYRSSEKSDFETMVKVFILALLAAVVLSLDRGNFTRSHMTEMNYDVEQLEADAARVYSDWYTDAFQLLIDETLRDLRRAEFGIA